MTEQYGPYQLTTLNFGGEGEGNGGFGFQVTETLSSESERRHPPSQHYIATEPEAMWQARCWLTGLLNSRMADLYQLRAEIAWATMTLGHRR